jgi:16S rRNA A1518/A1519 N6-dimethyltransferase RsmA/KsgA/DIM1 with predicted DNA glycosylase/AP lyase activity
LDRDLAVQLQASPSTQVIQSDVLKVDFMGPGPRLEPTGRLRVVEQLPYNIIYADPGICWTVDVIADISCSRVIDRMVGQTSTSDYSACDAAMALCDGQRPVVPPWF